LSRIVHRDRREGAAAEGEEDEERSDGSDEHGSLRKLNSYNNCTYLYHFVKVYLEHDQTAVN
jgi:hypothetical protein